MKKPEDFNILIVDDEILLRSVIATHLEMDGYKVFTADGGMAALEIVKQSPIDFVITDVRMPNGDGEFLLQKIREIYPEIPVVVLVTGFSELTKEDAINKGAMDLLSKPIDFDIIEQHIKKARMRVCDEKVG